MATLTIDRALLGATERGGRITGEASVQTEHAKLQRFADAQATRQVYGVDVAHEPMLGGVGESDRLHLTLKGHDGDGRAEEVLAQDGCPQFDIDQRCRLEVVALPIRTLPADERSGPVPDRRPDQRADIGVFL